MIDNIFKPLFEVTINPEKNLKLYYLLFNIVGIDSVDDESAYEVFSLSDLNTLPEQWNKPNNPHYVYWMYYLYANIQSLNLLRNKLHLNTFSFRPHCGEAGSIDHLVVAFLLSNGISHGVQLEKSPVLMYLYYLMQIGIAMSPISNNK